MNETTPRAFMRSKPLAGRAAEPRCLTPFMFSGDGSTRKRNRGLRGQGGIEAQVSWTPTSPSARHQGRQAKPATEGYKTTAAVAGVHGRWFRRARWPAADARAGGVDHLIASPQGSDRLPQGRRRGSPGRPIERRRRARQECTPPRQPNACAAASGGVNASASFMPMKCRAAPLSSCGSRQNAPAAGGATAPTGCSR